MAVITNKERVTLKLELDGGIVNGRQRITSKNINNMKLDASDEAIHGTGLALSSLQSREVFKIKKVEELALEEE